jgi:hypothetical protein
MLRRVTDMTLLLITREIWTKFEIVKIRGEQLKLNHLLIATNKQSKGSNAERDFKSYFLHHTCMFYGFYFGKK